MSFTYGFISTGSTALLPEEISSLTVGLFR